MIGKRKLTPPTCAMIAFCLRLDEPQQPGRRIPSGHPPADVALHHAATQPALRGHYRRKRLVVLVGQKKALAMAVKNTLGRRDWTEPREWLASSVQDTG